MLLVTADAAEEDVIIVALVDLTLLLPLSLVMRGVPPDNGSRRRAELDAKRPVLTLLS